MRYCAGSYRHLIGRASLIRGEERSSCWFCGAMVRLYYAPVKQIDGSDCEYPRLMAHHYRRRVPVADVAEARP